MAVYVPCCLIEREATMNKILFAEKNYSSDFSEEQFVFLVPEPHFRTYGCMSDGPMEFSLRCKLDDHGFYESGDWTFEVASFVKDAGADLEALGFIRDANFQKFIDEGGDEA